MPNPRGMVRTPEAHSPLAELLIGLGRRVVSFDPPGAFASSRPPRLGLAEMLACSHQALQVAGVAPPVDVVGHSQATLCQLALALVAPQMVRVWSWSERSTAAGGPPAGPLACPGAGHSPTPGVALRPVGHPAGGRAGQPGSAQAAPAALPGGVLRRPQPGPAGPGRAGRPAAAPPPRARWQASVRQVDLRPRLEEISAPALVLWAATTPRPRGPTTPRSPPPSSTAAWRSSSTPATTPSWRNPTASPPSWPASSPRSPGNKSQIRRDLRLHHRPPGGSLALSPEKTMEAGTMSELAFWIIPSATSRRPWSRRCSVAST